MNTSFYDLVFKSPYGDPNHIQAVVFFKNGYGASVIQFDVGRWTKASIKKAKKNIGEFPYEGLYEVGVLEGNKIKNRLTYDTPLTNDTIRNKTPREVEIILRKISELPSRWDEKLKNLTTGETNEFIVPNE